ncbi:putative periplasmic serine endoprotease DegP-like [Geobacter sp. OR-1]|uniref:DegQ family serine endoprotease n=1 Tax=Geobacter sp. OR-1 TaxID=1266765 RepID=UPI0005420504|nr:DegQ family serine endoprotease [Geobacter sp. OR-1]GAM09180.1 putative periplasmic serine endoprotease DegP-like [Geobacter sp. OR-1]
MRLLLFLILSMITVIAVPGCSKKEATAPFTESSRPQDAPVKDVPKDIMVSQQAFMAVAKTVTPSVVNISTVTRKRVIQPFFEFSPFFDDFFGGGQPRPRYRKESSLGSGFIINKEGYIITNDHVVKNAETIQVKLSNDKVYNARIVGEDPKTDIAVIKLIGAGDLPVSVLGDSDKLQVGQWAIAIGNPFGLDRTVTVGVISATGRSNMGIETYEDFIQTDASINPGNSGGPLLNVYGEVIGINTAIVAAGQGIGFAIPINMAKTVITQLIKKGSVPRGWLGVSIQPVTEDIARSFGLNKTKGALVAEVMSGSPAERAGIRQGDIITQVAGKEIKDPKQLQIIVAEIPIGQKTSVTVFRDGKSLSLSLTIVSSDSAEARSPRSAEPSSGWFGLYVEEIPRSMRKSGVKGVVVTQVDPESQAAESIQPGDIITSVNQRRVANLDEYAKAIKEAEQRGSVALLVNRGNTSIYVVLRLR